MKSKPAVVLVHLLYWTWHAIWILAVLGGVAPYLIPSLWEASIEGQIPWEITAYATALTLLPLLTLGAGVMLAKDHRKLFRFFYGVGGVAMTLLCFRLFGVREATAGVQLLLGTLAVGVAFYTADIFGALRKAPAVRMVGYSLLLIIGVYVGITMGLYAVPLGAMGVVEFFDALFHMSVPGSFGLFIALLLFAYSFTLFVGLPLAMTVLYTRGWWRELQQWGPRRRVAAAITAGTIAGWIGVFIVCTAQPQRAAFDRLAAPPVDVQAQEDLLDDADEIRDGLVNAYLGPYRYWGQREDNRHLARLYRDAFGLDRDFMPPQHAFNVFARPLLYDGEDMRMDRSRAPRAYEEFFDAPLQRAEKDAVLTAMASTYDRSEAEAGLLDAGERRVLLAEQHLDIDIEGDIATFTLHEIYDNQTVDRQEVFYYFSLPEGAALTGLRLGHRGVDYEHTVAPRGAAQAVYKAQRRQRVDPALLEQVGPRQYRLRVFPIEPQGRARMHLWMEWTTLANNGRFALPRLAEARNVYWDEDDTKRTVDGDEVEHEHWLPQDVGGGDRPRTHAVQIGDWVARAEPAGPVSSLPEGRFAVVLDTSLSMAAHAESAEATLQRIVDVGLDADLYVAPSPFGAEQPRKVAFDAVEPHYYGGHSVGRILGQLEDVADADYDGVILVTDAGSFAFAEEGVAADARTPLWIVHLGGLPPAYPDKVGDALRGVGTDVDAVLQRMVGGPVDGYAWTFSQGDGGEHEPAFAPLAARALIRHLGPTLPLDELHAIAIEHDVVTPWSSMIVLVNDQQRDELERASEADDRFDREGESGVEDTTAPSPGLSLTSTPEPEEWLLIFLAAAGLLVAVRFPG